MNSVFIEIKETFDREGIEIPYHYMIVYPGEYSNPITIKLHGEEKRVEEKCYYFYPMTQEKEHILFTEIKNGNEEAFNKAFDLYYPRLCFFADKVLHDFDLSRSVVQQVFVDLWIKRDRLQIDSLQSYLYQSVRNASLDVLKHKKAESKYLATLKKEEAVQLTDLMEDAELSDRINRAIQNLPEKCREVFVLCRFEELKYAEIAARLNISVKTVEMQISIALKKLRKELSDYQMIQLLTIISRKKLQLPYRVF